MAWRKAGQLTYTTAGLLVYPQGGRVETALVNGYAAAICGADDAKLQAILVGQALASGLQDSQQIAAHIAQADEGDVDAAHLSVQK